MLNSLLSPNYKGHCDGEGASLGAGSSNIVESDGDSTNPCASIASLYSLKSVAPSL